MKTFRFISVLLALLVASWSCSDDDDDLTFEPVTGDSEIQLKSFISPSLTNNAVGNQALRNVQVYLPKDYDAKGPEAYPVVYLLHGLPFSEYAYTAESSWDPWIRPGQIWPFQTYPDFPAEGFRSWVDNMINSGTLEPMIIVMPNAGSEPYYFSFYTNSALNGNFEDFIVKDLVNFIDSNYNTRSEASGRSLIGHSQGGYAAFKLGLLYPDKFSTVASHSGLLLLDAMLTQGSILVAENPNGWVGPSPEKFFTSAAYAMSAAWSPNMENPPFYVDFPIDHNTGQAIPEIAMKWYAHDVFSMLDTKVDNVKSLKGIYLDIGMSDELGMEQAYPFLIQKLDAYGVEYTYAPFEGGHFTHAFERLAVSLEFCSNSMKE